MKNRFGESSIRLGGFLIFCVILTAGCQPAVLIGARAFSPAVSDGLMAPLIPPAARITATPTLAPVIGVTPGGFKAWCLPVGANKAVSAWPMPQGAITTKVGLTGLELVYPVSSCTFEFRFNTQPVQGVELRVFETKNKANSPWLTVPLVFSRDDPLVGYATLNHTYIVNPPLWNIEYRFSLAAPGGKEYWSEPISFKRDWLGRICWNGKRQDPVTLRCDTITYGDRHPTDWGYLLPVPTPGGDPAEGYFLGP